MAAVHSVPLTHRRADEIVEGLRLLADVVAGEGDHVRAEYLGDIADDILEVFNRDHREEGVTGS